jgi:hypothetical protein
LRGITRLARGRSFGLDKLNNNPNPLPGNFGSGGLPAGGGLPGHGGGIGGLGHGGGLGKLFKGKIKTDPSLVPHPPHFLGGSGPGSGTQPAPPKAKVQPLFKPAKPIKPMKIPPPPSTPQPKPMTSTPISLPNRGTATNSQLTGPMTTSRKRGG